jgi:hypothetical protein
VAGQAARNQDSRACEFWQTSRPAVPDCFSETSFYAIPGPGQRAFRRTYSHVAKPRRNADAFRFRSPLEKFPVVIGAAELVLRRLARCRSPWPSLLRFIAAHVGNYSG